MATYDETVGAAQLAWNRVSNSGIFELQEQLVVATAIANHATPTANGYFTASDVIQLMDFPASCVFLFSIFRTVTAGTSTSTCDLGEAGGQEFDNAVALDATAGTVVCQSIADANMDNFYSAANTADLEVLTANLATGSYEWTLIGWRRAAA